MDSKLINRVCGFILNLRHLGFNGSAWPDIMAAVGELSPSDKAALSKALEAAGGVLRGKNWVFVDLDVDTLRATPIATPVGPVKLVKITAKVEAGCWGFDEDGRFRFVKDPSYIFPINDTDPEDTEDEPSYFDPPKGKIDGLDL